MIMTVCSYRDTKLNIFGQPFFLAVKEKEDIVENIRRMCASPELPKVYFEYDLYLLGTFDDKVGMFTTGQPEFLVSLGDFKYLAAVPEEVQHVEG